ncbi:MAG: hypothetical protein ACXWW7_14375 [Nocardioides sp.]
MVQMTWLVLGVVIVVGALRAERSQAAFRVAIASVAALFIGAGAVVNAAFLLAGRSYSGFADASSFEFVTSTWQSLVVPHEGFFITLLVVFEASMGVLVLLGGRGRRVALLTLSAFLVALLAFSWWYAAWSVPMVTAFLLLLRADRKWAEAPAAVAAVSQARSP